MQVPVLATREMCGRAGARICNVGYTTCWSHFISRSQASGQHRFYNFVVEGMVALHAEHVHGHVLSPAGRAVVLGVVDCVEVCAVNAHLERQV